MELTLDQALQKGIEAHKAGQAQEADKYYTAILKANPKHPDANHNMGVLAVGIGKVEEALPFFKSALEANSNIVQYWLSYIDTLIKLNRLADAKAVFDQAKSIDAKGEGFDQLEKKLGSYAYVNSNVQELSEEQHKSLVTFYNQSQYQKALTRASELLNQFPSSINLYNIIGATNMGLGKLEEAIEAYKKALSIKPDYADAYNNMGNALQKQGKLEEAIEAYNKALAIQPDNADAYYNMGVTLKEQGRLDEAIEAYNKAIVLKPDYADAYNNMGATLNEQGRLDEAMEAYNKALSIKPDNAEAYYNMGNALQDQGKLEEAIEAYNKALSIKPDYAKAHSTLSSIKEYTLQDNQFLQAKELYGQQGLSEDVRCHLSFALAKMYEDIGDLDQNFTYLSKGNALRKQLLNYSIDQDKNLFSKLKNAQSYLFKTSLDVKAGSIETIPVFIIGMPRSGTTLVEQIISSHSEVLGAGELNHVSQLGLNLSVDPEAINTGAISKFRQMYLSEVSKLLNGKQYITDKMPQNFRFIPLICAALPEAKIIHVQRNAAAICWSNFKQNFAKNGIGYCFDLKDVVDYYKLYNDLTEFWQSQYGDRIYNLNYENLTTDQENQTRKLIKHIGLSWEEACLSPHKNKRSVKTASQQQVRQKVYKGSSEAWRKYEPYLNGAFDNLPS